jgi:hypothetical protein
MRLSLVAILGGLATTCSADWAEVWLRCHRYDSFCKNHFAWWHNDHGQMFEVQLWEHCWRPNIPNIIEFCVDGPRGRLHFNAVNQPKRCMVRVESTTYTNDCKVAWDWKCVYQRYEEVPCTW